jgi:hypothetical protein
MNWKTRLQQSARSCVSYGIQIVGYAVLIGIALAMNMYLISNAAEAQASFWQFMGKLVDALAS